MKKSNTLFRTIYVLHFCILYAAGALCVELPDDSSLLCNDYMELVTLVTDRDLYISGEEIGFSALLQCNQNTASDCLSRIMYVDIYKDLSGYAIRQKIYIENGEAHGSIAIPSDFPTGNYYLRAYTNYQKNYRIEDLTYREILILNPEIPLNVSSYGDSISLFFQGGTAIFGFPSRAVFQLNAPGKSMTHAEIITGTDKIVSTGTVINRNTGFFEWTPLPDNEYYIKIRFSSDDSLVYPIRGIHDSGWGINVTRDDENIHLKLKGVNTDATKEGTLIITDRFLRTIYSEKIQLTENSWEKIISVDRLEKGINYIGIKDDRDEVITFTVINNPDDAIIPLEVQTNKQVYAPLETVEVKVYGPDNKAIANSGLTASAAINGSDRSFETRLEYGHFTEVYAIIHENSIRQNDDSFQRIFRGSIPFHIQNLPEIRNVSLTGIVLDARSKEPIGHCWVYLSVLGDKPQLHVYESREDGSFIFNLKNLEGSRKLFVGIDYRKNANAEILINNEFIQEYIPPVRTKTFEVEQHALYDKMYINMQAAKKFNTIRKISGPIQFQPQPVFTNPDISVVLSDYIELPSMHDVFRDIVPYTYLRERKNEWYFQMKNPENDIILNDPLVLFDNVPVFDIGSILKLAPETIERIDIIYQKYFLGEYGFNGIINIISKKNQFEQIEFPAGTVFFDYQAENSSTNLSPQTREEKTGKERIPDFNNVLYWQPGLIWKNSPLQFEFITGNNEAEYRVVVQGITPEGISCYGEKVIIVKRD